MKMLDPRIVRTLQLGFLIVMLVYSAAEVAAQIQPPIRSKVVLVPLDIRVLDRDGNPVRDLTAADFEVYEDGVRQELAHFLPLPLAGETRGSMDLGPEHPLAEAAATHRSFILVLGSGQINAPGKGLDGLVDFVKNRLRPTDRVGVTAYLRTSEPTTDHAAVLRFLERYRKDYQTLYDRIAWDGRPRGGVLGSLSGETRGHIDAVFRAPGIPVFSALPGVPASLASRYATHNYVRWTIQQARRIPGEKHVIVVAEGPLRGVGGSRPASESPNAGIYVKLANEARVALSYINTGGVPAMGLGAGRLRPVEHANFFAPTDHRAVTEQTGGIASFYGYASTPLDRIERGSRFQYLLGYYPTATHAPDVDRTVRVEVNRRDVTTQYRHGYRLASSVRDEEEFRAAAAEYRLTTELARLADTLAETRLSRQGFRRTPSLRITAERPDGSSQLKVSLAFNPARVSFAGDDDSQRVVLHLAVVLDDLKGAPVGEVSRTVELALSGREFADAKSRWIAFDVTVPFTAKPARVRAVVYDYDRDGIRSASSPIRDRK